VKAYPAPGSYRRFTALRLRWYITSSGQSLLRHWQWLVLAALFIPGLPIVSLLALSAQMVGAAATRDTHLFAHLGGLAGLHVTAVLWILPQRQNLRGGAFAAFTATLPISPHIRRGVDLTLLAFADILLLIPAAIALVFQARSPETAAFYQSGAIGAAVAALFAAQMAVLATRPFLLLAAGAADALLSFGLTLPLGVTTWLLLAVAFSVPTTALLWPEQPAHARRHRIPRSALYLDRLPLFLRIQGKALAAHPFASALRLGVALALAIATDALLVAFDFDARALPSAIAALAASAVILAGFYRTLRHAHASMQEFLMTLPVSPLLWPQRDTFFVVSLGLIPFGLMLSPLVFHGLASAPLVAVLGFAYVALIAGLRTPLRRDSGLSVILAVLIAAGWAGAAIAAVLR
jgi:hypothetical protein